MSLNSLPLLRDSHMASKPLFTTCAFRRGGVSETSAARRGVGERRLFFSMMDRSRQAVPWETTAARPRGGKVRSGTGGGVTYLFADERAGDDDGDVHARALRGGEEAGDGAVAVRLIRGRAGVFCRWSRAGPSRQGFGSRRSRRGTHRHRGLVERFEHVVRGFFSEEAFARFGLCPHAQQGGRPKPDRSLPIFAGPEKKSHGHDFISTSAVLIALCMSI